MHVDYPWTPWNQQHCCGCRCGQTYTSTAFTWPPEPTPLTDDEVERIATRVVQLMLGR